MNTKPANKAFQNSLRTDQYILIQQSGNDAKWHIYVVRETGLNTKCYKVF